MPPSRRCCFATEMTTNPTLQGPVLWREITCPQETTSGVCNGMNLIIDDIVNDLVKDTTGQGLYIRRKLAVIISFFFGSAINDFF